MCFEATIADALQVVGVAGREGCYVVVMMAVMGRGGEEKRKT